MVKKYHNHKLQTNPWHREEEPHNNQETPGRQTKQSNQPLPPSPPRRLKNQNGQKVTYNKTQNKVLLSLAETVTAHA